MKKFVSVLIAAMLALVSLVGCGKSDNNGKWIEVASIFCTDIGMGELHSTYRLDIDSEYADIEEYNSAPQNQKEIPEFINISNTIIDHDYEFKPNRSKTLNELKNSIGKTYYFPSESGNLHVKFTINSYVLHFVKVRLINSETLEINYFNGDINGQGIYNTVKVKPTTYKITYFND